MAINVLITAGPTWVALDNVRVISNIATGSTGLILANEYAKQGAKVTLIAGPAELSSINPKINLVRFRFFEELRQLIVKELKRRKYDVIIHSAAVSDYRPAKINKNKVKSDKSSWQINLVPTVKLIDLIRNLAPRSYLVGFKFEPDAKRSFLVSSALNLIRRSRADLIVANTSTKNKYTAYILNDNSICGPFLDKRDMKDGLINTIFKRLPRA